MPGPKTPAEALPWIKEAMAAGRFVIDPHFTKRAQQRRYTIHDARRIVETATSCVRYSDPDVPILAGGTPWRVPGRDLDDDAAKVGVEAFKDHLGKQIILITIMAD